MDMYEMQIAAETRQAQRREEAEIRHALRAARAGSRGADGRTGRIGTWWWRRLRPGTPRSSTPLPNAS